MGITIHYGGRIEDATRLEEFCAELIDIAESMRWKWKRLDKDWNRPFTADFVRGSPGRIAGHLPLKGVILELHPDSESLEFLFDSKGVLRNPVMWIMVRNGEIREEDASPFVKTQFAPIEVHVTIVKLLRYLGKKYMPKLEVMDEGEYWETGDLDRLRQKQAFLADKMAELSDGLSSMPAAEEGESVEALADRLEGLLREKWGRKTEMVIRRIEPKEKVLILCTGNSARSQMAEGFFEKHGADRFEASSAGVDATALHPLTLRVMEEAGVDMSGKRAKSVDVYLGKVHFSTVITVCGEAKDKCPVFSGAPQRLHWPFEDPAALEGSDEEKIGKFREVRDRIEGRVKAYIAS